MNAPTTPPKREGLTQIEPSQDHAGGRNEAPKRRSRLGRIVLMLSVPVLLILGGAAFWMIGGRYVETENAYIEQAKALISADVDGRIVEVDVVENQAVKKGDVLFRIDEEAYRIEVQSAEAALANARLDVEQLKIRYLTAKAKLTAADEALDVRKRWFERNGDLAERGFSSQSNVDQLRLSYQQAKEAVTLVKQEIESTKAALGGRPSLAIDSHPAVKSALAKLESAKFDLERTTVRAPADGVVSQTDKLNVGQHAAKGAAMLTLVETGNVWVEANLKETQLANVHAGQKVEVTVDAFPDVELSGEVASIGAGTGSEFSLIPAQNATGNWVKVVQRLPVRIALEGDVERLRTGMSVSVAIDTGKTRLEEYEKAYLSAHNK